jgi:uridine kinase
MKPYLIGIAGRSCSGKTTLVHELSKTHDFLYISQDNFFRKSENADRWEEPECLRNDMLFQALLRLKNGDIAHVPTNGWTEVCDKTVYPQPVIIVEGYLLFVDKNISDLFDKRVWVDVSDINLVCRRIQRDGSLKYIDKISNVVVPISKKYESLQKSRSDIIIDGNKSIDDIVNAFNQLVPL